MQFWHRPSSRATYCSMLLAVCCSQYVAPRATYTYKNIHLHEQHIALVSAAVCLLAFPLQYVADGATYHKQQLYKNISPRATSNILLWCLLQYLARGCVSAALSCSRINIKRAVHCEQHTAETAIDILVIHILHILHIIHILASPHLREQNIAADTAINTSTHTAPHAVTHTATHSSF